MMRVLTDLVPQFTLDDIWQVELGGREPRPALRGVGETLYPEAQRLVVPAAIFERFPVQKVMHDRVYLAGGQVLRGPDVAHVLAPASEVVVGMATIGAALEERSSQYFQQGDAVSGYLLDCMGTAAVINLVQQVCAFLEPLAAEWGYPIGFPLSPGEPGWPLAEQRVLFGLVPADRIGVTLTEGCAMRPNKSVSFVLGLGLGIRTAAEGSQCDYCSVRETCRHRRHAD
ncbi:MAG: hypothetical protein WCF84_21475 [Anaerolineae bacterium]